MPPSFRVATKFAPFERESFSLAIESGFTAAELWTGPQLLTADRVAQILAWSAGGGFRFIVHFPNTLSLSDVQLDQFARLAIGLGCRDCVIHDQQFEKYAAAIQVRMPGVSLAVENHVLDDSGFAKWASTWPGLTLDVEHLWKFTLNDGPLPDVFAYVDAFLSEWASKLKHVHMPGYVPGFEEHRPMYCSREMVFGVLDRLAKIGYDGLVTSEVDTAYQTPEDLRMDALLVHRWLKGCLLAADLN